MYTCSIMLKPVSPEVRTPHIPPNSMLRFSEDETILLTTSNLSSACN